jgi:hypothetical protein
MNSPQNEALCRTARLGGEPSFRGEFYARFGVALSDELGAAATAAAAFAEPGETVAGVVPVEPEEGTRLYLVAYGDTDRESWLVLDAAGSAVRERQAVRGAASIAALVEIAEETAAGGDLDELRAQLVALRLTENPEGIDEAEEAVSALQQVIGAPPRVATPAHLDRVGAATRRLEAALGADAASPFAEAMKLAGDSVQAFVADVEAHYKVELA